ncbi:MAG: hypothetical protein BroJett005_29900 [Ignavibacteriota bacterium]|nr:MAG: hypothetical protein BroJett005_29900 [Ignavibacteriota bacterium]
MQPSKPNECGVLDAGLREVVATHGRSYAAIRIALCEDGLYRIGVEMHYAHGGFAFPVSIHAEGFATLDAGRTAALVLLLRSWHAPFPSEPESVRAELADMRAQVEARLRQPTLF